MTPIEAINTVEQIRLAVSGSGKDHDAAREAVSVLRKLAEAEAAKVRTDVAPARQG